MSSTDFETLRARFAAAGQDHVFKYLDAGLVSAEDRAALATDLASVELDRVNELYTETMKGGESGSDLTPLPDMASMVSAAEADRAGWRERTSAAIAEGKVGLILLAGGQGTRLGFDKPKGMFQLDLPGGKTLFKLQAQRIAFAAQQAAHAAGKDPRSVTVPWYVMTSPMTHEATVAYFEECDYFGLAKESVFFFQQGTLPCLTDDGKIIMETPSRIARAPDGNGGIYLALHRSGALADMERRGIEYLHCYCVDNAVSPMPDPHFIGYCLAERADVGAKVVYKAHPHEKVGVVALRGGRPAVVEYSEISDEVAESKGEDGRLVFGAGNICVHFYTRKFLQETCAPEKLPKQYHMARKKIPYADASTGETVEPSENTGIKLESFIFDVFPKADKLVAFEVERATDFSPLKNKEGADSPASACDIVCALHRRWLTAAGAEIKGDASASVEVSPLVSAFGDNLSAFSGASLQAPLLVVAKGEPLPAGEATPTQESPAPGVSVTQIRNGERTLLVYVVEGTTAAV